MTRIEGLPEAIEPIYAAIAIRQYAIHSYLYYVKDSPIISDGAYDELCRWLLKNYKWIKPHDINGYLDKERLREGSGYHLASLVCGLTKEHAELRLKQHLEGQKALSNKKEGDRINKKLKPKKKLRAEDLL